MGCELYEAFSQRPGAADNAGKAGERLKAEVTVTNTGKVAGDEVVQLYLSFPDVKGAPLKALRGFKRVHLEAGASQKVEFELKDRDLGMVTEIGDPIIAAGEYKVRVGGGQPGTDAPGVSGSFQVASQQAPLCRNRCGKPQPVAEPG